MSKAIAAFGLAAAAIYQVGKLQHAKEEREADEVKEKERVDREARLWATVEHYINNPTRYRTTSKTANDVREIKLAVIHSHLRQLGARAENLNGRATRLLPAPVLGYSEPPEFLQAFALILLGENAWWEEILVEVWKQKVATGEVPPDPTIDPAVVDKLGFVLASLSPPSARLLRKWFEELSCITPLKIFKSSSYHFHTKANDVKVNNMLSFLDALDLLDEDGYKSVTRLLAASNLDPTGSSAGKPFLQEIKLKKPHPSLHNIISTSKDVDNWLKQFAQLRAALHYLGLNIYPIARVHSPGYARAAGHKDVLTVFAVDELNWDGVNTSTRKYRQGQKQRKSSGSMKEAFRRQAYLSNVGLLAGKVREEKVWITNFKVNVHGVGIQTGTGGQGDKLFVWSKSLHGGWQEAIADDPKDETFIAKATVLAAHDVSHRAKAALKRASSKALVGASLEHAQALSGEIRMYKTEGKVDFSDVDLETGFPTKLPEYFSMLEHMRQRDADILNNHYVELSERYTDHLVENMPPPPPHLDELKEMASPSELDNLTPTAMLRKEVEEFVKAYMRLLNGMLVSTPINAASVQPAALVPQRTISNEAMEGVFVFQGEGSPRCLRAELVAKARERLFESDRLVKVPSSWAMQALLSCVTACVFLLYLEFLTLTALIAAAGQANEAYRLSNTVAYCITAGMCYWTSASWWQALPSKTLDQAATFSERKDAFVYTLYKAWYNPEETHWEFVRYHAPKFISRRLYWKPVLENDLAEMRFTCSRILGIWTWRLAKQDMEESIELGSIGSSKLFQLMSNVKEAQADEKIAARMSASSTNPNAATKSMNKKKKRMLMKKKSVWKSNEAKKRSPAAAATQKGGVDVSKAQQVDDGAVGEGDNGGGTSEVVSGWETDNDHDNDDDDDEIDETDVDGETVDGKTVRQTISFPICKTVDAFLNLPVHQDDDNGAAAAAANNKSDRVSDMSAGLERITSAASLRAIANGTATAPAPARVPAAKGARTTRAKKKGKQAKKKTVKETFAEAGYTLKRQKKHYVWSRIIKGKDGFVVKQTVTTSKTPRNQGNADKKILSDIKRQNRAIAKEEGITAKIIA